MTLTNEGKHVKGTKSLVVSFVERPEVKKKFEKLAVFYCEKAFASKKACMFLLWEDLRPGPSPGLVR